jgi:hypothetical protein
MIFQCSRCLKFFDTKFHYNKHLGRKIPCKLIINEKIDQDVYNNNEEDRTDNFLSKMDNNENILDKKLSILDNINQLQLNNPLQCKLCGSTYKYLSGLCKHKKQKHPNYDIEIKNHNEKSEIEQVKEIIIKQAKELENLNEKNKQLELLIKTSKAKTKNITNNTNNNTNNGSINNGSINNGQIINNHFNIVSFGEEDIKKLTQQEILSVLKSRSSALLNLVKMVHLNERLPEFHNVLINNIKSNYGSIVDENKLILRKKDKIIADIISNRLSDLKELVNEYKETKHLSKREKEILDEMIHIAENYNLDDEDIDGNMIKPTKKTKEMFDELIYAFYNNRSLIDRTLKKLTENVTLDMLLDV